MKRTYLLLALLALVAPLSLAQGPGRDMNPMEFQQAMTMGPKGTLTIRAIQGTKDGPTIGAEDVVIDLLHRDQVVHQMKARLNELGVAIVPDVPVAVGVRPIVRVRHANVLYQEGGPELGPEKRDGTIDVTVYETTDQPPPWRIVERSLAAARVEGAMDVRERLVVENTGDRTWLGGVANAQGRRTTFVVPLPAGSHKGELQRGFYDQTCGTFTDAGLAVQVPLMPGSMVYGFGYLVPAPQGKADITLSGTAPVELMKIYVADDGTSVEARGLTPNGSEIIGSARARLFQAEKVPAGQSMGIIVSGLLAQADLTRTQARTDNSKMIAIIGVGGVLLVGIVVVLLRRRSANAPLI